MFSSTVMGFWWRKEARDGQKDSRAMGYEPEKEGISGNGKEPRAVPGTLLESELPLLDSIGDDIGHHPNLAALHPDIGT